jgi:hypothetical protein
MFTYRPHSSTENLPGRNRKSWGFPLYTWAHDHRRRVPGWSLKCSLPRFRYLTPRTAETKMDKWHTGCCNIKDFKFCGSSQNPRLFSNTCFFLCKIQLIPLHMMMVWHNRTRLDAAVGKTTNINFGLLVLCCKT